MGIDPMVMSQGMYNNFGGPSMMNGMNMGMGFDAGQGAFGGGFNGQPQAAWNAGGQDKFNQNAFGGGNNFGANAGYGAGYNMPSHQGNFNQMHPQPQYPQNDFHQQGPHNSGFQRGRGRGRGGYPYSGRGRGNHNQVNQGYNANNAAFTQQVPQGPVRRGSPEYTPMNGEKSQDPSGPQKPEQPTRDEFAPGDAEDRAEEEAASKPQGEKEEKEPEPVALQNDMKLPEERAASIGSEAHESSTQSPVEENIQLAPIQTFISDEPSKPKAEVVLDTTVTATTSAMPPPPSPSVPTGPSNTMPYEPSTYTNPQGRGAGRGFSRGAPDHRGGLHGRGFTRIPNGEIPRAAPLPVVEKAFRPPVEPKGLGVVGAPTGPKALRQSMPSTSVKQDTGFSIVGRASAARANGDVKIRR